MKVLNSLLTIEANEALIYILIFKLVSWNPTFIRSLSNFHVVVRYFWYRLVRKIPYIGACRVSDGPRCASGYVESTASIFGPIEDDE
jgi:hypothetical protein